MLLLIAYAFPFTSPLSGHFHAVSAHLNLNLCNTYAHNTFITDIFFFFHFFLGNDKKEHNLLEICEAYFKVKPGGNVDPRGDPHGELKNQNHLTTIGIDKIEKIVADFGLENEAALLSKVKEIQEILYAERQKRPDFSIKLTMTHSFDSELSLESG